jgi:hypothetical protein
MERRVSERLYAIPLPSSAVWGDTPTDADETYNRFREILETHHRKRICPMAGAERHSLGCSSTIAIATTTGFDREVRDLILKRLPGKRLFTQYLQRRCEPRSPGPLYELPGVVSYGRQGCPASNQWGDTPLDLQAANHAGLQAALAVLSGRHTANSLAKEKHSHILPSIAAARTGAQ